MQPMPKTTRMIGSTPTKCPSESGRDSAMPDLGSNGRSRPVREGSVGAASEPGWGRDPSASCRSSRADDRGALAASRARASVPDEAAAANVLSARSVPGVVKSDPDPGGIPAPGAAGARSAGGRSVVRRPG